MDVEGNLSTYDCTLGRLDLNAFCNRSKTEMNTPHCRKSSYIEVRDVLQNTSLDESSADIVWNYFKEKLRQLKEESYLYVPK